MSCSIVDPNEVERLFSIAQVYDLGFDQDEEFSINILNQNEKLTATHTHRDMFLKEKSIIGRKDFHDIQVADPYMGLAHCQFEWKSWFKKTRSLVKQYSFLLKIRELPISICRHIAEFLKEPRRITFTDFGSPNGTLLALKPNVMVGMSEGLSFRLGEKLHMIVEKKDQIVLDESETTEDLGKKIREVVGYDSQEIIIQDNIDADEKNKRERNTYHLLRLKLKFKTYEENIQNFTIVSNKVRTSFLLGNCPEADIGFDHDSIDQYQCEVILANGEWHINEWVHEDKNKKTWLNLKNKQYDIIEDTELLVGKTKLHIVFNQGVKEETKRSPNPFLSCDKQIEGKILCQYRT